MAHVKLPLSASVLNESTALTADGFFTNVDKMRPYGETPDRSVMGSIGGWQNAWPDGEVVNGKARGLFTYKDGDSLTVQVIGSHIQLYGWQDATRLDITPFSSYQNTLTNALSTTNTSTTVRFQWASHGRSVGDRIQFRTSVSMAGLYISGGWDATVLSISGANSLTFAGPVSATASVSGVGGDLQIGVFLVTGNEYSVAGPGWGVGTWGNDGVGWGGGSTEVDYRARWHSFGRWGIKNLLANPSNQTLFEWQSIFTTPSELNTTSWSTLVSGWSAASATALTAATGDGTASKTIPLQDAAFHRVEFDISGTNVGLTPINGSTSIGSTISSDGHHTIEFFNLSDTVSFKKTSAFAGTVTNISVKQMERLAAVPNAPSKNSVMIVTEQNSVMVGGTIDTTTGLFNPMLVRWSAFITNINISVPGNQDWIGSSIDEAGDNILNHGGRIVALKAGRGEVLILTDTAMYRAVFVPDPRIIYSISLVATGCGCMSSRSICDLGGVTYWLTTQGQLMAYAGGFPQEINLTVLDDMFSNIAFIQQDLVHMEPTARFQEAQVHYPDKRDNTQECSRYIGFTTKRQSFNGTFIRPARHDSGITQYPWAVDGDGVVFWQEIAQSANNAAIGEAFDTGLIAIGEGDTLVQVDRFISDFSNFVGGFQLTIKGYIWPNATPITYGPFNVTPTTTKLDLGFIVGRFLSFHGVSASVPSNIRFGSPMVNLTDTGMSV